MAAEVQGVAKDSIIQRLSYAGDRARERAFSKVPCASVKKTLKNHLWRRCRPRGPFSPVTASERDAATGQWGGGLPSVARRSHKRAVSNELLEMLQMHDTSAHQSAALGVHFCTQMRHGPPTFQSHTIRLGAHAWHRMPGRLFDE